MGADILQRSGLKVMVFGAGRSLDYQHIAKLPAVDRVVMSDVVDLASTPTSSTSPRARRSAST